MNLCRREQHRKKFFSLWLVGLGSSVGLSGAHAGQLEFSALAKDPEDKINILEMNHRDAARYCRAQGKRLPVAWELAVFAQWTSIIPEMATDTVVRLPEDSNGLVRSPLLADAATYKDMTLDDQKLLRTGQYPQVEKSSFRGRKTEDAEVKDTIERKSARGWEPIYLETKKDDPTTLDFFYKSDHYRQPNKANDAGYYPLWSSSKSYRSPIEVLQDGILSIGL